MQMHSTKKVIRLTAARFRESVEAAGEALQELIEYGYEDVFEDIAEELLDEAEDFEKGSVRSDWYERAAAFCLLQAMKIDLAEEDGDEEED